MKTIPFNTRLEGSEVSLLPLEERHFEALYFLSKEPRIWEFMPADMSSRDKVYWVLTQALRERDRGTQFPFVIFHQKEQRLIGSTRLVEIVPEDRKLEIGWTWLHPDYWGGPLNLECKWLLLNFCFEELKTIRVQLKTDELNLRSQKAIEKLGAQREGLFRNERIRDNGTFRNSVYFSIIDTEWLDRKRVLAQKLEQYINSK